MTAIVLGGVWFALMAATLFLLLRRRRELWLPLGVTFVVLAGAVTGYGAFTTFRDVTVNEQLATGVPASQVGEGQPSGTNVQLAAGGFEPLEHSVEGTAELVRLTDGGRVVTLTSFRVDNGPDLRVYLVDGPVADEGDVREYVDLGALRGNVGNQQYQVPSDLDTSTYATVVIWCRAFSAGFAKAELVAS